MSRKVKPPFEYVHYDSDVMCWGQGNDLVGPRLIARIQLSEPTKEQDEALKADYFLAKSIYDTNVTKGQKFIPCGKDANTKVEAVITSVTVTDERQYLTWKQTNCPPEYKPASGKWSINAFISMVKSGRIKPI